MAGPAQGQRPDADREPVGGHTGTHPGPSPAASRRSGRRGPCSSLGRQLLIERRRVHRRRRRPRLGERPRVWGSDARLGWEPHFRIAGTVGIALGRDDRPGAFQRRRQSRRGTGPRVGARPLAPRRAGPAATGAAAASCRLPAFSRENRHGQLAWLLGMGLGAGATASPRAQAPAPAAAPDGARAGVAARPRALQGHRQGPDPVRRPPAGHRAQPQGRGLDRSAAEELRLRHRADQVHLRRRPRPPRRRRRPTPPAPNPNARAVGGGRPRGTPHAHRRQHRPDAAARREAAGAQQRALHARPARGGLLHQGRHLAARRDVHRRRAHGRPRLGRGRQRRRLGHGAGDGAGARLQHAATCRPSGPSASRCGTTRKPG